MSQPRLNQPEPGVVPTVGEFMALPLAVRRSLGRQWKAAKLRGNAYARRVIDDIRAEQAKASKGNGGQTAMFH